MKTNKYPRQSQLTILHGLRRNIGYKHMRGQKNSGRDNTTANLTFAGGLHLQIPRDSRSPDLLDSCWISKTDRIARKNGGQLLRRAWACRARTTCEDKVSKLNQDAGVEINTSTKNGLTFELYSNVPVIVEVQFYEPYSSTCIIMCS